MSPGFLLLPGAPGIVAGRAATARSTLGLLGLAGGAVGTLLESEGGLGGDHRFGRAPEGSWRSSSWPGRRCTAPKCNGSRCRGWRSTPCTAGCSPSECGCILRRGRSSRRAPRPRRSPGRCPLIVNPASGPQATARGGVGGRPAVVHARRRADLPARVLALGPMFVAAGAGWLRSGRGGRVVRDHVR